MILQKEISTFSSLGGHIILGGGGGGGISIQDWEINLKIILCQIEMIFLPIDNTLQADRSSFIHRYIQDKNTNTNGKHLADLCMISNLNILNGIKIGHLVGKYTYHYYNVSSTGDYIITETDFFDKVRYFQVLTLTLFSDHCPIRANMDIKSINSKSKNADQKKSY